MAPSRSFHYRTISVASPEVVQRAMPHLETMGLLGLVRQPWNIASRSACDEFIRFQSSSDAFPPDHRLHKVIFDKELFSRLYQFPPTGSSIGQDCLPTDPEFLAKYIRGKSRPFGWRFDAILDPQLSAVFQILNAIFHPERPRQITRAVAMVVCKAWEVKDRPEKPDWSAFVWETFWRLKAQKKHYLSIFLLHAYRDMGLLSPDEKQGFENLQNRVVGSRGPKSQPRCIRKNQNRYGSGRAVGRTQTAKVTAPRQGKRTGKRTLTAALMQASGTEAFPMDQKSYAPAPVMEAAAQVKAPLGSSETPSASPSARDNFSYSDAAQYKRVMMGFERPISLFATISKMLGCTNDEEVVPKVDALCAEQKEVRDQRDTLRAEVKVLASEKANCESTHEAQLIKCRKKQEELQAEVEALQRKLIQQEQKVLTFAETLDGVTVAMRETAADSRTGKVPRGGKAPVTRYVDLI